MHLQFSFLLIALLSLPALGEENILARADVPNRLIPQGEVRLVDRGNEVVVQSIIETRFPDKVLSKIIKSERENWPGNPEMESYIAALEKAFAECEKREKGTALIIDFVASPNATWVDLSFPPDSVWTNLPLSTAYVQKNQEYILADSFGKKSEAVIRTLRTLNPMEEANGK